MAFGEMPANLIPELVYQQNFGNLPNKTVYLDRLAAWNGLTWDQAKSIDKRAEIKAEIKSLTTTSNLLTVGTSYTATSGAFLY